MHKINIKHLLGTCPIHIAPTLKDALDSLPDHLREPADTGVKTLIVTNATLAQIHRQEIRLLQTTFAAEADVLTVPDGESAKRIDTAHSLWRQLSQKGLNRSSRLIAYGGGVITDLVGFVAVCYMRGIRYVSVPTSLLAQTDAALGGKTGINLPEGKNLVGCFHHPECVLIATSLLGTLPRPEIAGGYAEIIKHALIADKELFAFLETHLPGASVGTAADGGAASNGTSSVEDSSLPERSRSSATGVSPSETTADGDAAAAIKVPALPDENMLAEILHRSCSVKATIVSADERERMQSQPKRMLLNLGHTFGHALEAAAEYTGIRHGQAVSIGICLAASVSRSIGHLTSAEERRIRALLTQAGLPTDLPEGANVDTLIKFMLRDKKNCDARIRLILLRHIGEAYVAEPLPAADIKQVFLRAAG